MGDHAVAAPEETEAGDLAQSVVQNQGRRLTEILPRQYGDQGGALEQWLFLSAGRDDNGLVGTLRRLLVSRFPFLGRSQESKKSQGKPEHGNFGRF